MKSLAEELVWGRRNCEPNWLASSVRRRTIFHPAFRCIECPFARLPCGLRAADYSFTNFRLSSQIQGYIKRNKHKCRGVQALDSVGEIVQYAKTNNFLKLIADQSGLGDHHVGVVLVYKGQLLGADNEFYDVPHVAEHQHATTVDVHIPPCIYNLLSVLEEATADKHDCHACERVAGCIRECVRQLKGK